MYLSLYIYCTKNKLKTVEKLKLRTLLVKKQFMNKKYFCNTFYRLCRTAGVGFVISISHMEIDQQVSRTHNYQISTYSYGEYIFRTNYQISWLIFIFKGDLLLKYSKFTSYNPYINTV